MVTITYETNEEREQIITQKTNDGLRLTCEKNIKEGNFLIFKTPNELQQDLSTYSNSKEVIENSTYGTREEMLNKLDVFLLNDRINQEQYKELVELLPA